MAEGDFIRNFFKVTDVLSDIATLIDKNTRPPTCPSTTAPTNRWRRYAWPCDDGRKPLPVSVVDALEAGLLAITMDEARRTRRSST
jgi:hypothetical protein